MAFNQYEPAEHELAKLRRKIEAGARFVVTQPVIDADATVSSLGSFKLPVWVGAWMSKRVDLLLECVGVERPTSAEPYDPAANLARLHDSFPDFGLYLAQLSFKKDWGPLLTRIPSKEMVA